MFDKNNSGNESEPQPPTSFSSQNQSHAGSSHNGRNNNIDSLTDQLADFKSFGAALMTTASTAPQPLTTSVGSGG